MNPKTTIVRSLLTLAWSTVGCQSAGPPTGDVAKPDLVQPRPFVPAPDEAPIAALDAAAIANFEARQWFGDAEAQSSEPFMGRYTESLVWGSAADGRPTFTSALFGLHDGVLTESGYLIVDTTPAGVRLRLFAGQDMKPDDVRLEIPITGTVEKLAVEAAHDKLATLGWDAVKPVLTVYQQSDQTELWHQTLDITDVVGRPVLVWHADEALSVEWRTATNYHRVFLDVESGSEQLRQDLDPRIVEVMLDPLSFVRASPTTISTRPVVEVPVDLTGLTTAQRWLVQPPDALGAVCGEAPQEGRATRVIELDEGVLLVAEAVFRDSGRRRVDDDALVSATCTSVSVTDTRTLHETARWSLGRNR